MADRLDTESGEYGPDIGGIDFLYGDAAEADFDEINDLGSGEGVIGIDYDSGFAIYHDEDGDTVVGTPSRVKAEVKKRQQLDGSRLEPGDEGGFFERVVGEVQQEKGEIERQRNRYQ
jgi:hypothetical protein